MTLSKEEKRTVRAVFGELMMKSDRELNTFLGSITIEEMKKLYYKLKYEDFCEKRGITYEQMTPEDYEDAAFEEMEERNAYFSESEED